MSLSERAAIVRLSQNEAGAGLSKRAALEALLFSSPDPVAVEDLARVLSLPIPHVRTLLAQMAEEYASQERGFMLDEVGGGFRLCSKPEYGPLIEEMGKAVRKSPLGRSALETLAIIAYRQPITRPQIESIRGVRAESAIATLLDRGLIEEKGRSDAPGRPILYGTSESFLVHFGLSSLDELPPLPTKTSPTQPGFSPRSRDTSQAQPGLPLGD